MIITIKIMITIIIIICVGRGHGGDAPPQIERGEKEVRLRGEMKEKEQLT